MNESAEPQIKDIEASVISDEERDLAENALFDFQKGAYTLCLSYLNKLEALRPKDLKVMHNKVVAEYYKSDLKKTELVKKSLNAICGQLLSTDAADAADVVEKCVMRYNQAILLYHTKQYNAALQIMSRLFSLIEPLVQKSVVLIRAPSLGLVHRSDAKGIKSVRAVHGANYRHVSQSVMLIISAISEESLAQKVCLLLIELYIATVQPDAALSLVNYIERQFAVSDISKISSTDKEGLIKPAREQKELKKDSADIADDAFRMRLTKCKIRIYLLTNQLKLCKKEWKAFATMGSNMNLSNIFLAANVEYLRGKCKKAITLLNASTPEQRGFKAYGESAAVLYYNNMACIHHALGKPNLACFYLQKALEENKKATENLRRDDTDPLSSQPLCTLGANKHYELIYSLGICYLHAGQHAKAFDCFTEAAQRSQNSPRVWLRMAECCIFSHNPKNEVNFNILKRRQDVVQKLVVSEFHKKIVLTSSLSNDMKYQSDGLSYAIPQPTLEFGMLCLKNAFYLLSSNSESVPSQVIAGQHAVQVSQATTIEALNLKISIFAASAYVSLCLGDYTIALENAKSLLALNNLPGAYIMLGKLYTAESLIFLDRINEALDYLKPEMLMNLDASVLVTDTLDKDKEKAEEIDRKPMKAWYPTNILTGKAVLLYNMAVAYAIRGQLDRSGEIVGQLWKSKGTDYDVPIHVIMLALYIELQLGRTDKWRSIIKRNYPQYF